MDYEQHKDTKTKHYIQKNVYEAAKERIKDAIQQSDNQIVLCSGGKDSTVTLHLVKEVYNELNIDKPVNVVFMDEEVISQTIINYVKKLKTDPEIKLYWLKIPLRSQIYNTGNTREYVQNDKNREHIREAPPDALTLKDFNINEDRVLDQYHIADIQASLLPGKICLFKGIRTDESLFRLTQIIRRRKSPHIGNHKPKHFECVPIYDWSTRDIFLYFYLNNIPYNPIYDRQMYAKSTLRVATPLHTESKNTYNHLREIDPTFYEKIIKIFPDMAHADRYGEAKKQTKKDFTHYPHTLRGLMQYIDDSYTENRKQNQKVKKRILWAYKKREKNKKQPYSDAFGGYPLYYLFQLVKRGSLKRNIMPIEKPSRKMYKFENIPDKEYIRDKNNRGRFYATKNATNK